MVSARRLAGVTVGLLVDRALGEPPAGVHPVVGFGAAMGAMERRCWADDRRAGLTFTAAGAALGLTAGLAVRSSAVAVGVSCAGRMLRESALGVAQALEDGELDVVRDRLPTLVGRDPSDLDESGMAAAAIESVAENTVDAVIAPACWAAVAGAPGALGYRALNTLDAMVGHRSPRYARFGWASARADDVANWVPARVTAALVSLVRPRAVRRIATAVRHGAPLHPSPNAGVAEAAWAGALGVELGGPLRYGERHEERPRLGSGPRPSAADIRRAVRLQSDVEWLLTGLSGLGATVLWCRS